MRKEIELQIGNTIIIDTSNDDDANFEIKVEDVWKFSMNHLDTLQDVLTAIDEDPTDWGISIEELLAEIEYLDSYERLLESELSNKPLWFIREFLKKVNDSYGINDGYSKFYDVVSLDSEHGVISELPYLNQMQFLIKDPEDKLGAISNKANNIHQLIFIITFSTTYL